ncbi:MAG TPA: GNAT family N-acetyltransferase [Polyangiaceae bacterium]|nr:GNAT family N-acetyltransferase [Polyangiaceae bacterium]
MEASRSGQELSVTLRPSAELDAAELAALFAASSADAGAPAFDLDRSLCWVSAHVGERLVGFVNVAWDGGVHAFLLDTIVHPDCRRRGIGTALVRCATDEARALGAEWLHVDYDARHAAFYGRAGFRPTAAGLIDLKLGPSPGRPLPGLGLRRYAAEDADGCAAVFASVPEWFGIPTATTAYLADLPRLPTWVATRDGRVVGFVCIVRPAPRAFEVHVLAVAREQHGQGIGRALLEHAERFARAQDGRFMLVKTLGPSHADAFYERTRGFYRKVGYEPLLETDRLWEGTPTLILVKAL